MSRGPKPRPIPLPDGQSSPIPEAPPELKGEAKKEWKRITAILAKQRVLTEADRAALTIYCSAYATLREAQAQIDEYGSVIETVTGASVKSPYLTVVNSCWERIRPLLAEFGLTPSARARLKLDDGQDDATDFF